MSKNDEVINELVREISGGRDNPRLRRALLGFAALLARDRPLPPVQRQTDGLRLEDILEVVASVWGIEVSDLRGKSRCKKYTEPRCASVYLVRRLLPEVTLVELGGCLGGRDHTTMVYNYQRAEAKMGLLAGKLDREFRNRVAEASNILCSAGTSTRSPDHPRQLHLLTG